VWVRYHFPPDPDTYPNGFEYVKLGRVLGGEVVKAEAVCESTRLQSRPRCLSKQVGFASKFYHRHGASSLPHLELVKHDGGLRRAVDRVQPNRSDSATGPAGMLPDRNHNRVRLSVAG
jgi:hypothetical protein